VVVRADAPAPKIVALIYVGDKQMYVFAAGPSHFKNGRYDMLSRASSARSIKSFCGSASTSFASAARGMRTGPNRGGA
jgi:hypothetical protein